MSVQTFVFLDLETSGLPSKTNPAKITEIALVCVSRGDIEKADGNTLPPISKLSLLINPCKAINPYVEKLTGLTNKLLANKPKFSEKVECINNFLELPKPVCLVAHNGDVFDYKILNDEYAYANATLQQDLLCIDSLKTFRKILDNNSKNTAKSPEFINDSSSNDAEWPDLDVTPEDWDEIDNLVNSLSKLKTTTKPKKVPKISYSLSNLYKMLLNKDPVCSHRAEADCIMLLECVIATKNDFLPWADENYKLLNKIKS